jgi:hypothetical protein
MRRIAGANAPSCGSSFLEIEFLRHTIWTWMDLAAKRRSVEANNQGRLP